MGNLIGGHHIGTHSTFPHLETQVNIRSHYGEQQKGTSGVAKNCSSCRSIVGVGTMSISGM